jgi:hypothetical protein
VSRNDALMERYEELRQGALGRQPGGTIWGLVVLRTKGMASWARSWREYGGGGVAPMPLKKESAPSAPPLSLIDDEVVRVLAGMVWALQKEA